MTGFPGQDFEGTIDTFFDISGTITDGTNPIAGVLVTFDEGITATTGADGTYTVSVPCHWSGEAFPTHTCYDFDPVSIGYENVEADVIDQDYTGEVTSTYIISGFVSEDGDDDTGDGSEENPYLTIQKAIDNATNDTHTIRVFEGNFEETIIVNRTLSIVGNGSALTIIDGADALVAVRGQLLVIVFVALALGMAQTEDVVRRWTVSVAFLTVAMVTALAVLVRWTGSRALAMLRDQSLAVRMGGAIEPAIVKVPFRRSPVGMRRVVVYGFFGLALAVVRVVAFLEGAADLAELPLDRGLGARRVDGFAPARGGRRAGGLVSDARGWRIGRGLVTAGQRDAESRAQEEPCGKP